MSKSTSNVLSFPTIEETFGLKCSWAIGGYPEKHLPMCPQERAAYMVNPDAQKQNAPAVAGASQRALAL